MTHKTETVKYSGSMNELAEDIGNLQYGAFPDTLAYAQKARFKYIINMCNWLNVVCSSNKNR